MHKNINTKTIEDDFFSDVISDFEYYKLSTQAEKVRWNFFDIPWQEFDEKEVTNELVESIKSLATVELTTYPGAMNFFREFEDDMDFTQWAGLWLYEETRHPQVLMNWLSLQNIVFSSDKISQNRKIYPSGENRIGTLCMNIISEMRAAAVYLNIAKSVTEPVIKDIALKLSADESRHAAGFYIYAKKYIKKSEDKIIAKMQALEMLYVWLNSATNIRHPAGYFFEHTDNQERITQTATHYSTLEKTDSQICKLFSRLTETSINSPNEIKNTLRELYAKRFSA